MISVMGIAQLTSVAGILNMTTRVQGREVTGDAKDVSTEVGIHFARRSRLGIGAFGFSPKAFHDGITPVLALTSSLVPTGLQVYIGTALHEVVTSNKLVTL